MQRHGGLHVTSLTAHPPCPGINSNNGQTKPKAEHLVLPICACVGRRSEVHGGWAPC